LSCFSFSLLDFRCPRRGSNQDAAEAATRDLRVVLDRVDEGQPDPHLLDTSAEGQGEEEGHGEDNATEALALDLTRLVVIDELQLFHVELFFLCGEFKLQITPIIVVAF
jgi:hypothetical protein